MPGLDRSLVSVVGNPFPYAVVHRDGEVSAFLISYDDAELYVVHSSHLPLLSIRLTTPSESEQLDAPPYHLH